MQLLRQLVSLLAAVLECVARRVRCFLLCGGIRLGSLLRRFERGDLALAAEERALFVAAAAACHRAARAQELAVDRDDAQAVARRFRDGERVVERVDDERACEQVVGDAAEAFLRLDELIRPTDDTLHPPHAVRVRGLAHLDGRERQECRAAEPLRLQVADGGFRCRGVFRDDVLLAAREGDVERRHIFFRNGQKFRDRACDAAAPRCLRLQHGAHGAAEAFVRLLHMAEDLQLVRCALRFAQGGFVCGARGRQRLPRRLHVFRVFLRRRALRIAFLCFRREVCGQLLLLACERVKLFLCGGERAFTLRLPCAAELDVLFEHGDGLLLLRQRRLELCELRIGFRRRLVCVGGLFL